MTIVLSSFRARQEAHERELAIEALKVTGGGLNLAARICGLDRTRFRSIVRRHGLQALLHRQPSGPPPGGNAAWRALADV